MVYGTEVIIPTELSFPTARTALTASRNNEATRTLDLNLIEEKREIAAIKMLAYQKRWPNYITSRCGRDHSRWEIYY